MQSELTERAKTAWNSIAKDRSRVFAPHAKVDLKDSPNFLNATIKYGFGCIDIHGVEDNQTSTAGNPFRVLHATPSANGTSTRKGEGE